MTKKNFVSMILGTIGGILFALGMCMGLLPQWQAFEQGVAVGAVGLVVLLITVLVRRKMGGKPMLVPISGKSVGITLLAIVGTVALGAGMNLVMVWSHLVPGIIVGMLGIIILLMLIPLCKGLKD
jgi:hypothetical protein